MNTKKIIFDLFLFTGGAAIGSLVTWKVVKTKYERIAQEEINSVKETWDRMNRMEPGEIAPYDEDEEIEEDDEDEECDFEDPVRIAYHELARVYSTSGEHDDEDVGKGEGDHDEPGFDPPYVITPNDFGDGNYDHELHCLTYYSDGVLSTDWYEKLDIEDTIGLEALDHFGDYAEDVVHVRNERLQADYEVVKDPRNYSDLLKNNPLTGAYAD